MAGVNQGNKRATPRALPSAPRVARAADAPRRALRNLIVTGSRRQKVPRTASAMPP